MPDERPAVRARWVSYLRVSTHEQAERDLSIPAQRAAIAEFAARHGASIAREYIDAGRSGRDVHRPQLRALLGDALARDGDIGTIVVHHTSRFMRDATEARLVKRRLRKVGVRVLSATQEIADDLTGHLVEGIMECMDEFESGLIGARTSAAMRESIRQGFYPGARPPFGYATEPVEVRPGIVRHRLVPDGDEAPIVRELFRLYVASHGALSVAQSLNERGLLHRGKLWNKTVVLNVVSDTTVAGTFYWGRHATREQIVRPESEWLALAVEPIVDAATFELAQRLRTTRKSRERRDGSAPVHVLGGLVHCAKCGASFGLESSGKRIDGGVYRYCYYNCRTTLRAGKQACPGRRIPMRDLDRAVLTRIADDVCTAERSLALCRVLRRPASDALRLRDAWRELILSDAHVGMTYARNLIGRVAASDTKIRIEPRSAESENAPP